MTAVPGHDLINLDDLRGRRLILYFFPKAGTAGCNRQACALRDAALEGADVFGASPDYPDSLAVFRQTWALPFRLLSDPDLVLARRYRVVSGLFRPQVDRSTFLIGADGVIERVARGVDPVGCAEIVRGWLREAARG